jgi:beta-lactamase class A
MNRIGLAALVICTMARALELTTNPELERRLRAATAISSGVFGVSVRHVEKHEGAALHGNDKFQMASVFKIPILIELFHQVSEGKVSLMERVEWTDPEHYFGSGVLATLAPGLRPTIHDLATLMIILSDNAATDILGNRLGFENITANLRTLGLAKTTVDMGTRDLILQALGLRGEKYGSLTTKTITSVNSDMVSEAGRHNRQLFLEHCPNCTTPTDMSWLLEKLVTGKAGDANATQDMLRILSEQEFNQRLPRLLPSGVRCAHKTGTLNAPVWVVNDAGIIYLPNGDHVIVSVFSHGPDLELNPRELKAAMTNAEERIGAIGILVYDFYTGQ